MSHLLQTIVQNLQKMQISSGVQPIGLDLAIEEMHMVQFRRGGGALQVAACCSAPYPCGRDELLRDAKGFGKFIGKALHAGSFKGKKVISCLPSNRVRIIPLHYELGNNSEEEEIIVKGAMEKIGGNSRDYVFDYLPIRPKERDATLKTALVVAARREEVIGYLDLLDAAGLEVQALDFGPAALLRLVVSRDRENRYPAVLTINFGQQQSYVSFLSGRRLMFDRTVEIGEKVFSARLAGELKLTEREARRYLYRCGFEAGGNNASKSEDEREISQAIGQILRPVLLQFAEEVTKLLIYAASETRGEPVEQIFLMGCAARYPGIEATINELLTMPAAVLNPFEPFTPAHDKVITQDLDPVVSLAMATGLALRGEV